MCFVISPKCEERQRPPLGLVAFRVAALGDLRCTLKGPIVHDMVRWRQRSTAESGDLPTWDRTHSRRDSNPGRPLGRPTHLPLGNPPPPPDVLPLSLGYRTIVWV